MHVDSETWFKRNLQRSKHSPYWHNSLTARIWKHNACNASVKHKTSVRQIRQGFNGAYSSWKRIAWIFIVSFGSTFSGIYMEMQHLCHKWKTRYESPQNVHTVANENLQKMHTVSSENLQNVHTVANENLQMSNSSQRKSTECAHSRQFHSAKGKERKGIKGNK
jgi:hypothetical protein